MPPRSLSIVLLLASTLTGCILAGEDEYVPLPPLNQQKMWKCHHSADWDDQSLSDAMSGEWDWVYAASAWTAEGQNTERERTKLIFSHDSTLAVEIFGATIHTSKWTLVPSGNLFKVEVDSSFYLLHGEILLCDNFLSLNSSWRDGADYYFERK